MMKAECVNVNRADMLAEGSLPYWRILRGARMYVFGETAGSFSSRQVQLEERRVLLHCRDSVL